jgi:DNA invertase Pin-like site-specific DNA recombinase
MKKSEPLRVALYGRVSTDGQTVDNQVRELEEVAKRSGWTITNRYLDNGISGAKGRKERPQFNALLDAVNRRQVDLVAAWSVDRLGRSLQDLVGFLGELQAKGVNLYLHKQALDTTTPSGRAMFQLLGVFAEFERAIIVERVKAGLARARAKGRIGGRPQVSDTIEAKILELRATGMGLQKIGRTLGIGTSPVQRVVREQAAKAPAKRVRKART